MKASWKIPKVMKDILMIGTSHFSRIPWVSRGSPNPGRKPRKVVISCGLNDKTLAPSTTDVSLRKINNEAQRIFPGSEIYLAQIAFSSKLPTSEQNNLKILNDNIKSLATKANIKYIPCIPATKLLRPCPFGTLFQSLKLDADRGSEPRVPQLGKSVINLSKYPLSDIEQTILDKGLNFIPTPKNVTKIPIMEAASNFGRRLLIAYHFRK